MPVDPLNKEQIELIKQDLHNGKSYRDISLDWLIHYQTAYRIASKAGLTKGIMRPKSEFYITMISRLRNGDKCKDLSYEYKVDYDVIRRIAIKEGLWKPRVKGPKWRGLNG